MSKLARFCCKNCKLQYTVPNKYSYVGKYCSNKCQQEYQTQHKINEWLEGGKAPGPYTIKNYLKKINGNYCVECGIENWNGKPLALQLEHKDGNPENNHISNLCLICPNCHSQTDTFAGKNRGNGRYYRRVRYAQGKSS